MSLNKVREFIMMEKSENSMYPKPKFDREYDLVVKVVRIESIST
jgi:hypothetical protein